MFARYIRTNTRSAVRISDTSTMQFFNIIKIRSSNRCSSPRFCGLSRCGYESKSKIKTNDLPSWTNLNISDISLRVGHPYGCYVSKINSSSSVISYKEESNISWTWFVQEILVPGNGVLSKQAEKLLHHSAWFFYSTCFDHCQLMSEITCIYFKGVIPGVSGRGRRRLIMVY